MDAAPNPARQPWKTRQAWKARQPWKKSTRSGASGCVEVAITARLVAVRDAKDRSGPVLCFGPQAWQEFIALVRDGRLDLPHDS